MKINGKVYRKGAEAVESIEFEAEELARIAARDVVWIDIGADRDQLRALGDALDAAEVFEDVATTTMASIRFRPNGFSAVVDGVPCRNGGNTADVNLDGGNDGLRAVTLRFAVVPNVVVSIHDQAVRGLDRAHVPLADPRLTNLAAGTLVGILLDSVLDGYFETIEELEEEVERLDEAALRTRHGEGDMVGRIVGMNRRVADVRRSLAPQRQVISALVRPSSEGKDDKLMGRPWPGLDDRLERAIDTTEHLRDLLMGTFDILMARMARHTNDVVQRLTVLSSVLLPAVVISGVMGMNFKTDLFDHGEYFGWTVAIILALAVGTLFYGRVRHWY